MSGEARLLNGQYALGGSPRSGGMAEVYRASDLGNNNAIVAVKLMQQHHGTRLADKVFEREYKALSQFEHPNVVRLLDGGRDEETGYRFLARIVHQAVVV